MDYETGKRLDRIEEMLYALCVVAGVIKTKETEESKDGISNKDKGKNQS